MYHSKVKIYWFKNYIFDSFWFLKIVNRFINKGNKTSILNKFFIVFKHLKKVTKYPIFTLFSIIAFSAPIFGIKEVKGKTKISKHLGYEKIKVPFPLKRLRRYKIAIQWFKFGVLGNSIANSLHKKIFLEMTSFCVFKNSKILKIKGEAYKEAHVNRLAVHYRWK